MQVAKAVAHRSTEQGRFRRKPPRRAVSTATPIAKQECQNARKLLGIIGEYSKRVDSTLLGKKNTRKLYENLAEFSFLPELLLYALFHPGGDRKSSEKPIIAVSSALRVCILMTRKLTPLHALKPQPF